MIDIEHVITLDFETYARKGVSGTKKRAAVEAYSLSKQTNFEYVTHPDFEVLGVSVKLDHYPTLWMPPSAFDSASRAIDWPRVAVLAQHTHFESLIMAERYGVRGVGYWLDTLSMDRALRPGNDHDLHSVAMHWIGKPKLQSPDVWGKRYADFTPEEWAELGVYGTNDADITHGSFLKMLEVFPEHELRKIDLSIRMYCEPTFQIDETILRPYAEAEKARRAAFLSRLGMGSPEAAKKILGSSDKFAAVLVALGIEPERVWSSSEKGWKYAFAKDQPFMQDLLEHEDEDIRDLAQARLDTKSTLNITRPDRFLLLGHAGRRAPVYIAYAAAHTLRYGGGDACNWQNLERVRSNKPGSGALRRSIEAPAGHLIVKADSGQIEARKGAWLAECSGLLSAFGDPKRDVYSEQASLIYRRPVNRKLKLADGTKPDDVPGQIGKVIVLALGYGMGFPKLAWEILRGPLGMPPMVFTEAEVEQMQVDLGYFSHSAFLVKRAMEVQTRLSPRELIIHCAVCWHIVETYRHVNKELPGLWDYSNDVIERMYHGDKGPAYRGTCQIVKDGLILPNGQTMWYPDLHGDRKTGWTYQRGYKRSKLYGGLATENVDQALCRIIVDDQMVTYADEGHPIGLMNHDEIASISPAAEAERDAARLVQIMTAPVLWAPGLPLAAESHVGTHYEG